MKGLNISVYIFMCEVDKGVVSSCVVCVGAVLYWMCAAVVALLLLWYLGCVQVSNTTVHP